MASFRSRPGRRRAEPSPGSNRRSPSSRPPARFAGTPNTSSTKRWPEWTMAPTSPSRASSEPPSPRGSARTNPSGHGFRAQSSSLHRWRRHSSPRSSAAESVAVCLVVIAEVARAVVGQGAFDADAVGVGPGIGSLPEPGRGDGCLRSPIRQPDSIRPHALLRQSIMSLAWAMRTQPRAAERGDRDAGDSDA